MNAMPIAALLSAAALTASASVSYAADKPPAADNQPAPIIMLVPVEIANPAMQSGCWAQFFDERNLKGDVFTLVGPVQLDSTDKASGRQFRRQLDSLMTGPKATLVIYEHKLFKDKAVTFPPNSKEPGLVKKLGFTGRIESIKLDCTN